MYQNTYCIVTMYNIIHVTVRLDAQTDSCLTKGRFGMLEDEMSCIQKMCCFFYQLKQTLVHLSERQRNRQNCPAPV